MSANPRRNTFSYRAQGDINCGRGQLGMTTRPQSTTTAVINQTPGSIYSDYYSRYLINIAIGFSADFVLAPIALNTGIALGYSACISCLSTGSPNTSDSLTIKSSSGTIIGRLWSGGKAFLTAVSVPDIWNVTYAVPEGLDNRLIVYTGTYPEVRTLPIQKEFYFDGAYQYGIKCIQSFDVDYPADNLVNYDNLNRIVFEGCTNFTTDGIPDLRYPAINLYAACNNVYYKVNNESITAMISCYGDSRILNINDSKGVFYAGCNNAVLDYNKGEKNVNTCGAIHSEAVSVDASAGGAIMSNCSIIGSNSATFAFNSTTDDISTSVIIGCRNVRSTSGSENSLASSLETYNILSNRTTISASESSYINGSRMIGISNSYQSNISQSILSSMISCDTCQNTIDGDGIFDHDGTAFVNNRAGITILSSASIPPIVTGSDIRYCVIGGYKEPTWSIDSKTGNFYGLGRFNSGVALPGFAEMYKNAGGIVIPYGRLLRIEDDKIRLATNGEYGFMISRPFENTAFVAGCPEFEWPHKYELDTFGFPIMQEYTRDEYINVLTTIGYSADEISAMNIPDVGTYKKYNLSYNIRNVYMPRSVRRDEWTTCEKMGIVIAEYSGTISAGDYLISGADGIAKLATHKTNIKVLNIIDAQYAKVDIANQYMSDYVDETVNIVGGIATGLPVNISIRNILFSDNNIQISNAIKCKIVVSLVGDALLRDDLRVQLVGTNTYEFEISYSRLVASYTIEGKYSGIIQPDAYTLTFITASILPAQCGLFIKI